MSEHKISLTTYYAVFAALLVLLVLTVAAARFDFGWANPVIAMGIAVAKALLIVLYFMHLRDMVPLVRLMAFAGVVWGALGTMLTMSDYLTRGWVEAGQPALEMQAIDRIEIEESPAGEMKRDTAGRQE